jgi:hypothetical protein
MLLRRRASQLIKSPLIAGLILIVLVALGTIIGSGGGGGDGASALTIRGTPNTGIPEGLLYSFVPAVTGGGGGSLTFSITNTPSWASFSTSTGALSGMPGEADIGITSSPIVISVSDGTESTSLTEFTVTVLGSASGSAMLSWTAPTQNADGTILMPGDLTGFNVYYGMTSGEYGNLLTISDPTVEIYVVSNLSIGTWFFWVTAFGQSDNESESSNVVMKTVTN